MCAPFISKSRIISESEFSTLAKRQQSCYIVYNGMVCNLTGFKHPGGNFLDKFNGMDATEFIDLSHATDKNVLKIIHLKSIGKLEDPDALLAPEDKDLRRLRRKFVTEGLFAYSGLYSLIEPAVLAIISFSFYSFGFWEAGAIVSFLLHLRIAFWSHDVMHHCIFADGVMRDRVFAWVVFIVHGMFARTELRVHAIHHAFPNVLAIDWVGLGPFQIDELHSDRSPAWFVKIQAALWFLGVVPAAGLIQGVKIAVTQCKRWQQFLMAARFILSWYFFDTTLFMMPFIAIAAFMYITCLNHFHMDKVWIFEERPKSFVRAMVEPTCNVEGGEFWTWLSGGLDLHIEHHLFPTMAHQRFRRCQPDVKALLRRHNIPYHSVPLHKVVWYNFRQFLEPCGPTMGSLKETKMRK